MKFGLGVAAAMGATVLASAASAAVTFVGFQTALNPSEALVTSFEGGPALSGVSFLQPGFTLSGSGQLVTGTAITSAAPATSATTRDETQYLSLRQGQSAVLNTPLLSEISFYVGSLDAFNSFTFLLADGTTQVLTGAMLAALPGLNANGDQTGFTTNGRLTFSFGSAIDQVTLASSGDSLEISDIGALGAANPDPAAIPEPTAIPEPASWAFMIVGFGLVGALLRPRRALVRA
jgi:hypothetical protein